MATTTHGVSKPYVKNMLLCTNMCMKKLTSAKCSLSSLEHSLGGLSRVFCDGRDSGRLVQRLAT